MNLPLRQKRYILFVLLYALGTVLNSIFNLFPEIVGITLGMYGIGTPLILLCSEMIIDLRNNSVFAIWFSISLLNLVIYYFIKDHHLFYIELTGEPNQGIRIDSWTHSLRILFVFLIAYKVIDLLYSQFTKKHVLNSFWAYNWWHAEDDRKITGVDVFFNIVLYFIIAFSIIF